jgi:fibronectin-binding autotransporter adhesin
MSLGKIPGSRLRHNNPLSSSILAAAAAVCSFDAIVRAQAVTPINATGWNSNNVFNSGGRTPSNNFDASKGFVLHTTDSPGAPVGTGLPTTNNNTFTSAANSNTSFQFQPFVSFDKNALELNNSTSTSYGPSYSTSATLTLATPAAYSSLSFLSADANGSTAISYTINFAGGTTGSGNFEGEDWYNGTGAVAIQNVGNIQRNSCNFVATYPQYSSFYTAGGQLYENDIALPSADTSLNIDSITFSIPSSGASQFNLYSLSGAAEVQTFTVYTYTGATSHVWDTSTHNFSFNGSSVSFTNGAEALFSDAAGEGSNVVSIISGGVSPGLTAFNNSASSYIINGPGGIGGAGNLEVDGGGIVTVNTSNTYSGATKINKGTLILGSSGKIASAEIDIGAGSTFTVNGGGVLTSSSLVISNSGNVNLSAIVGSGGETESFAGLTLKNGSSFKLTTAAGSTGILVVSTPSLYISTSNGLATGQLDIGTADLDLPGQTVANISLLVKQGYASGTWTGKGITSSAAANDATHLTAIGVIINADENNLPLYGGYFGISTSFDGDTNVAVDDVLVKYTYYGDANLDGVVDGSDYSLIDSAFLNNATSGNTALTGWFNGDFNYDGVVDGSDYTLIDNAFNRQGNSLGVNPAALLVTATAEIAAISPVPEPAMLGLLTFSAIGLLSRRQYRHKASRRERLIDSDW